MSEKKKQEYTTGGLKNRQDVENALASAEYRPSQEVTDAASDLKQWQANRPGDYESAYQGRIDGLMEDLLDRKEFSYSYGADPLYRQYAQLYTQNAQNASADAAAALTGGYGSSYAASAARQAYQQQIGALSEAIPTLYRLALDTYQSGGDALVEQIDQLNGQEQNAQQKYERELADYYTQLEQKGNAYNTAYTQDYGRYQDYLGQLDSLYGYYAAQEQQEAARRQQGFNNVMTVLGLLGDAAQLAITGTTGLGSMAGMDLLGDATINMIPQIAASFSVSNPVIGIPAMVLVVSGGTIAALRDLSGVQCENLRRANTAIDSIYTALKEEELKRFDKQMARLRDTIQNNLEDLNGDVKKPMKAYNAKAQVDAALELLQTISARSREAFYAM